VHLGGREALVRGSDCYAFHPANGAQLVQDALHSIARVGDVYREKRA
jgi:hypothetical protein